jgi:hypothetical protein
MAAPKDSAPVGVIVPYKARRYNEDADISKPTGPKTQKSPRRSPAVRPMGKRIPRG